MKQMKLTPNEVMEYLVSSVGDLYGESFISFISFISLMGANVLWETTQIRRLGHAMIKRRKLRGSAMARGRKTGGGSRRGRPNWFTAISREAFSFAFNAIGGAA